MARTESTMLALGTPAPDFSLPSVADGEPITPAALRAGRPLLVIFLSRHCPYVQHVAEELARIDRDYRDTVAIVGISSNDVEKYPDDAPERIADMARERGYTFPIVVDETQEVAVAYAAACTPDFFLFDADGRLAYRGQLDASRPGNGIAVNGADLRRALDAVVAGHSVDEEQRPSVGCNIKWKPGRAPAWFGGVPR